MTREKLKSIILDWELEDDTGNVCNNKGDLSDRILAALDEERAGEVVLGQGPLTFDGVESSWHVPTTWRSDGLKVCGRDGALIFRPSKP